MEFWNDEIVNKSWDKLIELKKEINFVLIGGWAVYLYTKLHKSKDIDIVIDYSSLRQLQVNYILNKNERLKKYEIKMNDGFDIDIYVPNYSRLAIPINDIISTSAMREGFNVPKPEVLVLLKLSAFINRAQSIKGGKDSIDILGLIFYADIDFKLLKNLAEKYKLETYPRTLLNVLENFDVSMAGYLNLNENSFSKFKKKYKPLIMALL
ncbi:hypothetical protein M1141_01415 [Candidatus Marsarchaeota archaeon]|nr:hypothetical protein [Candidatus Marsarchaeota archaeon]